MFKLGKSNFYQGLSFRIEVINPQNVFKIYLGLIIITF